MKSDPHDALIKRRINRMLTKNSGTGYDGESTRTVAFGITFASKMESLWYGEIREAMYQHHAKNPHNAYRMWYEPIQYRSHPAYYADQYVPDFVVAIRNARMSDIGAFTGSKTHTDFVLETCVPIEVKPPHIDLRNIKNKIYLAYNPVIVVQDYPSASPRINVISTYGSPTFQDWNITNFDGNIIEAYLYARRSALRIVAPEIDMSRFTVEKH